MQPVTQRLSRTPPQRPARTAFSLIELMIVITIIAILMSLLLVGVQAARNAARVASVTVEFKNMEKSIADFKAKFGAEPPSRILLCENGVHWTTPTGTYPTGFTVADIPRSRALIRQIWPDYRFPINAAAALPRDYVDFNEDGDTNDLIGLNGAECLVFFLGGVPDQTGNIATPWAPLGFSTNPENPFTRGGARLGPYHEFNAGRLRNIDGAADTELMPEYLDSLPGQRLPILYASSYGGRGYRDADLWVAGTPSYPTAGHNQYVAYATVPSGFAWHYRRYTGAYPFPADPAPNTDTSFNALPAFNPKSCQLISPGIDGEYGLGGILNTAMELAEPVDPPPPNAPPTRDNSARAFERDNITNFKGGTIN